MTDATTTIRPQIRCPLHPQLELEVRSEWASGPDYLRCTRNDCGVYWREDQFEENSRILFETSKEQLPGLDVLRLCGCKRQVRLVRVSPLPGRAFFECFAARRRPKRRDCGYFRWEDGLLKRKSDRREEDEKSDAAAEVIRAKKTRRRRQRKNDKWT